MRKYKCEVVTTNTYIVEIDENVINEEWMDNYSDYYTDIHSIKEHAANVAWQRNMFKDDPYEGYGYIIADNERPWNVTDDSMINKGIKIRVISENDEIETEAKEIK